MTMSFNTWTLEDDEGLLDSEGVLDSTWVTPNEVGVDYYLKQEQHQTEYFSQTHFHMGVHNMARPTLSAMTSPISTPTPIPIPISMHTTIPISTPTPIPIPISMPTTVPISMPIPMPMSSPPPSPPSLNFGQFSRPIMEAKAILQRAGIVKALLRPQMSPKSAAQSCTSDKSCLLTSSSAVGSNGAFPFPFPCSPPPPRRTPLEIVCPREEVSLDYPSMDSGYCSEKTRNNSSDCPLTEEFDLKAEDKKYSAVRKSGSSKRTRVAKMHNKSEKRRRDRINEKIKTLQHLIPNSGKIDKSSILDEAIEYLKYLQYQIQHVSMQSGMAMRPLMLLTGMQMPNAYHQMGMDMAMGMGHTLSQMASVQALLGQQGTTTTSQLHPSPYVVNPTNGYTGVQSSTINTPYDMHFAQNLVDQHQKQQ